MQAIMETLFDAAYLVTVVTLGCIMVKSAQDRETKLFGWMAVILGCGDAFHLVPRAWALCTDGLAAHAAALGAGKFITSIIMTIFYVILYHIGKRRYGLHIRALTGAVYALAAAQVLALPLSRGMDAAISGVAGLGHICLGAGLVVFFLSLKKTACTANVQ